MPRLHVSLLCVFLVVPCASLAGSSLAYHDYSMFILGLLGVLVCLGYSLWNVIETSRISKEK